MGPCGEASRCERLSSPRRSSSLPCFASSSRSTRSTSSKKIEPKAPLRADELLEHAFGGTDLLVQLLKRCPARFPCARHHREHVGSHFLQSPFPSSSLHNTTSAFCELRPMLPVRRSISIGRTGACPCPAA